MHTTPSDAIAADAARRRARIAALGEIITRMTERRTIMEAERTQLILQVARAEQVLDWRTRAGVALGDVYADLDSLDFALSTLAGVTLVDAVLLLTIRLQDASVVRVAFAGDISGADLAHLHEYARQSVGCDGIVLDGDGYRLLLTEGGALLTEGCLLAGDLLAVQRLPVGAESA